MYVRNRDGASVSYVRNRDGASVSLGSTIQQVSSLLLTFATILETRYSKPCLFCYYVGKPDTKTPLLLLKKFLIEFISKCLVNFRKIHCFLLTVSTF